jgi:hypothetical protein
MWVLWEDAKAVLPPAAFERLRAELHALGFVPRASQTTLAGYPHLIAEWHPSKNEELTPWDVVPGSNKKLWWKCPKGPDHEWAAEPRFRTRPGKGTGCPCCSGHKVSITNCLATVCPELATQWHPTKNGTLTPRDLTSGSSKKVWWICVHGPDHEWQATAASRASSTAPAGCPFCADNKVSVTNCLATRAPELAAEWHPTRNGELTPEKVHHRSFSRVWWSCPVGPDHEWCTQVSNRNHPTDPTGCPFCNRHRLSVTNALAVVEPGLAAQWHPTKNGKLTPHDINFASSNKVWWQCPRDASHAWETSPNLRSRQKTGCPYCANREVSSTNNLAVVNPELASEWHPTKNGKLNPDGIVFGSQVQVWWRCAKGHEWNTRLTERSIRGMGCPFCSGRKASSDHNLEILFPELMAQWHPTKNIDISPKNLVPGSHVNVWWTCSKGHDWESPVYCRAVDGQGCPYCAGVRATIERSIQAFPEVLAFWDSPKNSPLTPGDLLISSNRRVWWACSKGHRWQRTVRNQYKSNKCPSCKGRVFSPDRSLAKIYPDLALEWDAEANKRPATEVRPKSTARAWWRCTKGHAWQTEIYQRTTQMTGCPVCSGRVTAPEQSLAVRAPHLVAEWHPTRNKDLKISEVAPYSRRLVWWRCQKGHEWQEPPAKRILRKSCLYCTGKRLVPGENSVAAVAPELIHEWVTQENVLAPWEVLAGSGSLATWRCGACKHVWTAPVRQRVQGRCRCPACGRTPPPLPAQGASG